MELKGRQNVLIFAILFVCLSFIVRLYFLQVVSKEFTTSAEKNVIKPSILEPSRGILYDRKGEIIVTNTPIFDIMVVPKMLVIPDTAKFLELLNMPLDELRKKLKLAQDYSRVKPSSLKKQIDRTRFDILLEHQWEYKGLKEVTKNTREYKRKVGANFLGYLSEVTKKDILKSNAYYTMGDLIGASGLERSYEKSLKGKKGNRMLLVDALGKEIGSFGNGIYDTYPIKGVDMEISIDIALQELGENLMQGKIGSIVAIEPKTGEILSFVSAPSFDPTMLTGSEVSQNWSVLQKDSLLPLFNRPLMALYPPGSIFKILNAIVAMSEGTINEHSIYGCAGGFLRNGGRPRCHAHPGPLNVVGAIQHSCNAYFAGLYVDLLKSKKYKNIYSSYDVWYKWMKNFGMGTKTGIDMPNEKPGLLPTEKFYDRWYKKNGWNPFTIISNSIGQGEVTMTPLQMANITACIANKGYFVQPHFFRSFKSAYKDIDSISIPQFQTTHVDFSKSAMHKDSIFKFIFDGMEMAVSNGTGFLAKHDSIVICGKTGTAQNPHGDDHSVFIAFAPKDNPKIAIAVIVENGGFGGDWAAPIASLMIEKYLTNKLKDQAKLDRIISKKFYYRSKYYQKFESLKIKPDSLLGVDEK